MNYWIIYTLKLTDDCWYVGRTTQWAFKDRMKDYWNGRATWFTEKHQPIRIYDVQIYSRDLTDPETEVYEDKQTLKMAKLRGYDHVRGGGYTQREPHWPDNTPLTLF